MRTRIAAALAMVGLVLWLAACGEQQRPLPPLETPEPDADAAVADELDPGQPALEEVPEDERIAAIEIAMNALAPVANQCWAAAAVDDFRLAGDVRAFVTIGRASGAGATVEITVNTTDDDVLAKCLTAVLGAYAWAPPLAGQAIELPFHFSAPAMQNVIDRAFVPGKTQAGVNVAVLLDETNTGNPALSLAEIAARGEVQVHAREAERLEIWHMSSVTVARVRVAGGKELSAGPGDIVIVPKGARVAIEPTPILGARIAFVPGGREGTLRAGALPGKSVTLGPLKKGEPQVTIVKMDAARTYPGPGRQATILVEPPAARGAISVGILSLDAGVKVPLHVHAKETEALYLLGGSGVMTIAGTAVPVTATSVVQVPPGVEHGFEAKEAVTALQLYTPAGPEQRFKKPPAPTK
ncbi:MAG TPA: cupin domain-containing protein [Kofleriaceae bacterium]|nr:cupin domain-containing protein [Kofleriaceae bacterium]